MIKELVESLKYVGHYFAIAFLRVVMGVFVLGQALEKIYGTYLVEPILAGNTNQWIVQNNVPIWVEELFTDYITGYWSAVAHFQVGFELIAGILLILGLATRPTSLLLIVYFWFFSYIEPEATWKFVNLFLMSLFAISWAGAGRCFGLDYYFYKRRRGFLW